MSLQSMRDRLAQLTSQLNDPMMPQGQAATLQSEVRSLQVKIGLEERKQAETKPLYIQALKDRIEYLLASGSTDVYPLWRELDQQDSGDNVRDFRYNLAYDALFGSLSFRLKDDQTISDVTGVSAYDLDTMRYLQFKSKLENPDRTYKFNQTLVTAMTIDGIAPDTDTASWSENYQMTWFALTGI